MLQTVVHDELRTQALKKLRRLHDALAAGVEVRNATGPAYVFGQERALANPRLAFDEQVPATLCIEESVNLPECIFPASEVPGLVSYQGSQLVLLGIDTDQRGAPLQQPGDLLCAQVKMVDDHAYVSPDGYAGRTRDVTHRDGIAQYLDCPLHLGIGRVKAAQHL